MFGIPLDRLQQAYGQTPQDGLWPACKPALDVFMLIADQWRVVPRWGAPPLFLGLDYAACKAGLKLSGVKVAPDLWDDIRLIEAGAKAALNGG